MPGCLVKAPSWQYYPCAVASFLICPCRSSLLAADIYIEQPSSTTLQFDPYPVPKNMSIFPANYSQGVRAQSLLGGLRACCFACRLWRLQVQLGRKPAALQVDCGA